MLGLREDARWYEWDPQTHELRKRVNPDGEILQVVTDVHTEEQAEKIVDDYLQEKAQAQTDLHQAALDALATNKNQMQENQALWDAAAAFRADMGIQNYDTTGKTQVQVLGDLVNGLKSLDQKTKQLANAIQTLLVHDQTTKQQLNSLIKLVVGEPDATLAQPATSALAQWSSLDVP